MQIFEGYQRFLSYEYTHLFNGSVTASYIRIHPVEWEEAISMRFELLGCGGRYCNIPYSSIYTEHNHHKLPVHLMVVQQFNPSIARLICKGHIRHNCYLFFKLLSYKLQLSKSPSVCTRGYQNPPEVN